MDKNKIINFANAYTNLCQQFGLMIDVWGGDHDLAITPLYMNRLQSNTRAAIANWERNSATDTQETTSASTEQENK